MAAGALSPALDDGIAIKKEIYLSSRHQRRTRCCMKNHHDDLSPRFHCFRCLTFPSLPNPLILLQWRYAFIRRKRPKSSLAPKLGVGMPRLIWLNTHRCLSVHARFVCVPLLMCGMPRRCSGRLSPVWSNGRERWLRVTEVRKPPISVYDLEPPAFWKYFTWQFSVIRLATFYLSGVISGNWVNGSLIKIKTLPTTFHLSPCLDTN